jgi:hypothetical protein
MRHLPPGWKMATVDEIAGGIRSNVVIGPFGSNLHRILVLWVLYVNPAQIARRTRTMA